MQPRHVPTTTATRPAVVFAAALCGVVLLGVAGRGFAQTLVPPVAPPQALHLFSGNAPLQRVSAAGLFEYDQSVALFAGASLRVTTNGDAANVHAALTRLPGFSLVDQAVVVWVRVDSVANLNELRLYFADSEDFANRIVYLIDRDRSQLVDNTWLRVTLAPSEGLVWGNPDRANITAFQIWVNDRGTAPVRVWFDGLSLAPQPDQAAAVITFDDGWADQFEHALPVMADLGFAGTAYVIPERVGTEMFMDMDQLSRLRDEYGWTVGAHGLSPLTTGTTAERSERLDSIINWFDAIGWSDDGLHLAYPNGAFDSEVLDLVQNRFRSARTIVEFAETIPPGDPHRLRSFNVLNTTTPAALADRIALAQANKELVVLIFHRVVPDVQAETVVSPTQFAAMMQVLADSGIAVVSLPDVLAPSVVGHVSDGGEAPAIVWDESLRVDKPPVRTAVSAADRAAGAVVASPAAAATGTAATAPAGATPAPAGAATDPTTDAGVASVLSVPAATREAFGTALVYRGIDQTAIAFGMDLKFMTGLDVDDQPTYFAQVDELFLSIVRPMGEFDSILVSAGVRRVDFEDLAAGSIGGDDFYLDAAVLTSRLGASLVPHWGVGIDLQAGYRDYSPRNKWAQVTQWSVVESPFAQTLTAKSLWIGTNVQAGPIFATIGVSPDLIGNTDEDGNLELTNNPGTGMPLLFFNLGSEFTTEIGLSTIESAVAVGGDAVKWVTMLQHRTRTLPVSLDVSLGWKAVWGEQFETYPLWEPHQNGNFTFSGGIAPAWTPAEDLNLRLGAAVAVDGNLITPTTNTTRLGFDVRFGGTLWYLYGGIATNNADSWNFARTEARDSGWEAGAGVTIGGITIIGGYTTAGFALMSGLYANRFYANGGDGVFLRIKNAL